METDIETKTEWPEVLRTLEATYHRLSARVLELNETLTLDETSAEEPSEPDTEAIELLR